MAGNSGRPGAEEKRPNGRWSPGTPRSRVVVACCEVAAIRIHHPAVHELGLIAQCEFFHRPPVASCRRGVVGGGRLMPARMPAAGRQRKGGEEMEAAAAGVGSRLCVLPFGFVRTEEEGSQMEGELLRKGSFGDRRKPGEGKEESSCFRDVMGVWQAFWGLDRFAGRSGRDGGGRRAASTGTCKSGGMSGSGGEEEVVGCGPD